MTYTYKDSNGITSELQQGEIKGDLGQIVPYSTDRSNPTWVLDVAAGSDTPYYGGTEVEGSLIAYDDPQYGTANSLSLYLARWKTLKDVGFLKIREEMKFSTVLIVEGEPVASYSWSAIAVLDLESAGAPHVSGWRKYGNKINTPANLTESQQQLLKKYD